MKKFVMALLVLTLPLASSAEIYVEGGVRSGGDKLSSTNGSICFDPYCPRDNRIGDGAHLAVGYRYFFGEDDTQDFSLALGYLWDSRFEEKTSAKILEATFTQHQGLHRLGIGLAYHIDPMYEEEISDSNTVRLDFDDALGIVFKYAYLIRQPDWLLGIRYTVMDYQTGSEEVDANSLGIYASKSFR
jgi:hypothetical protein